MRKSDEDSHRRVSGGAMGQLLRQQREQRKHSTSGANVDTLLARLDRVQARGAGKWVARCPSHEDRSPSLSVREAADGTILLHCFSGCSAADIVAAVGLQLADLFPSKLADHLPSKRDRFHFHAMREAFRTLHREALIVAVAGEQLARGEPLDEEDNRRLWEAVTAIRSSVEACVRAAP